MNIKKSLKTDKYEKPVRSLFSFLRSVRMSARRRAFIYTIGYPKFTLPSFGIVRFLISESVRPHLVSFPSM